jgi:hypothetical protein
VHLAPGLRPKCEMESLTRYGVSRPVDTTSEGFGSSSGSPG